MADDPNPTDDDKPTPTEPDIETLIAKAVESATAGLRAKNRELLAEAKAAKDLRSTLGDLDPAEVRERLDQLEDIEAGSKNRQGANDDAGQEQLAAAQRKFDRERKRLETQLTESKTALDNARAEGRNFLLNSALDSAIGEAEIAGPYRRAVRLLQRDRVAELLADEPEMSLEAATRIASETLQQFVASDEGKHYVQARVTNGGGARGSAHGARGAVAGAKPVHQMTELEKVQFVDEHGYDAWTKHLGDSPPAASN